MLFDKTKKNEDRRIETFISSLNLQKIGLTFCQIIIYRENSKMINMSAGKTLNLSSSKQ